MCFPFWTATLMSQLSLQYQSSVSLLLCGSRGTHSLILIESLRLITGKKHDHGLPPVASNDNLIFKYREAGFLRKPLSWSWSPLWGQSDRLHQWLIVPNWIISYFLASLPRSLSSLLLHLLLGTTVNTLLVLMWHLDLLYVKQLPTTLPPHVH